MSLPPDDLSINDFLEDESFRRWMKERRPEDRLYWQQWLSRYPEKEAMYQQAVVAFLAIEGAKRELSDREVIEKSRKILELIPDGPAAGHTPFLRRHWWSAAAAVILVAGLFAGRQLGWLPSGASNPLTNRKEEKQLSEELWEVADNETKDPKVIVLPDNSSVVLSSGSSLRFRKRSDGDVRQVFLQGEAFFEVAKDPTKPFFVYTDALTVKVVGTGFQIRSFSDDGNVFVKVKTGKVEVTSVASPGRPVLLSQKQQLRLDPETDKNNKEETKSTDQSLAVVVDQQFTYEYVSVPEIFDQLASVYHFPFQYDREVLKSCTFTGQLNDMPLPEKIRLICLTIESDFNIVDNQVIIHSRGCR